MPIRCTPTFVLVLILCLGAFERVAAQTDPSAGATPAASAERRAQFEQFVSRWGTYVQQVYGIDAQVWARRIASEFLHADAGNVQQAMTRNTIEGAMASINGYGHRLPDDQAKRPWPETSLSASGLTLPLLGSVGFDMVYTPIQPCRVVDTRFTGAGPIATSGTRSFRAAGAANYTSQGGSATNCGMNGQIPGAVVLNVTAVFPTGPGHAIVYPFGSAQPTTASVNFVAGAIVNNSIITQVPDPAGASDFTIFTTAQADYVVDIVGYFDSPAATPIECLTTPETSVDVAVGNVGSLAAPACAVGHTPVSLNCSAFGNAALLNLISLSGNTCVAYNASVNLRTLVASQVCCRVPGR
jgi:hypothetical protein